MAVVSTPLILILIIILLFALTGARLVALEHACRRQCWSATARRRRGRGGRHCGRPTELV